MNSLSSRLLVSVSVLLLIFFGATIAVLDRAFTEAGEQARRDILDGHLVALLAAAEPDDAGQLAMPSRLREPRFQRIGSGLYAELRELDGNVLWRSRSALGMELLVVAVLHLYIHHRAESSAVLCRHTAFHQGGVLDGVAVEHREETKEVTGVVHHRFIQ